VGEKRATGPTPTIDDEQASAAEEAEGLEPEAAAEPAVDAAAELEKAPGPTRRRVLLALGAGLLVGGGGGFAGGYYYAKRRRRRRKPRPPLDPAYVKVEPWNPSKGPELAKVTLVVFIDYQCPYCARVSASLEPMAEKYGDDLRLVIKHHPLPRHRRALGAALAVQAARRQGEAWPMHLRLLQHRDRLRTPDLAEHAGELGLDVDQFNADLADPALKKEVLADDRLAQEVGARSTPTLFINGRGVRGARPQGLLEAIVDDEIVKAEQLLHGGTPLAEVYRKRAEAQPKPSRGK